MNKYDEAINFFRTYRFADGDKNFSELAIEALQQAKQREENPPLTLMFGKGEILVTPTVVTGENTGKLYLQPNKGTGIIGERHDMFAESNDDVILAFGNIESLDVVMERLSQLRGMMCGDYSGCREIANNDHEPVKECNYEV